MQDMSQPDNQPKAGLPVFNFPRMFGAYFIDPERMKIWVNVRHPVGESWTSCMAARRADHYAETLVFFKDTLKQNYLNIPRTF